MRCPSCGARNVATAPWCTQCFEVLESVAGPAAAVDVPPPPPASSPSGDDLAVPPPSTPASPLPSQHPSPPPSPAAVDGPATPPPVGAQRDIRIAGDRIEWRCARCEAWSPMERSHCTACDSPRVGFAPATTVPVAASPRWGGPLVASALLPGLGHLLLGHLGSGTARLLLWLLWAGGAVLTVVAAGVTSAAVVLGTAATGLWALTLHDLGRLADGRPQVLGGRVLAWSVVAVTALLVLTGLVSSAAARP